MTKTMEMHQFLWQGTGLAKKQNKNQKKKNKKPHQNSKQTKDTKIMEKKKKPIPQKTRRAYSQQ